MKNKNLLFTIIYWIIGIVLFSIAYLLFAFGTLHFTLSSFTDETLFRTSVEVNTIIPGMVYLLGGNLTTSIELYITNAIGISFKQTINNVTFEGFKIDWITCSFLLASLLIFIIDAIFKKYKVVNYTCGGLIILCGIALLFEPLSFAYFNQSSFNDLHQYLETSNNAKISYSNPCAISGAIIILIVGILIICYQIYKSIKIKKNTSIKNKEMQNQN